VIATSGVIAANGVIATNGVIAADGVMRRSMPGRSAAFALGSGSAAAALLGIAGGATWTAAAQAAAPAAPVALSVPAVPPAAAALTGAAMPIAAFASNQDGTFAVPVQVDVDGIADVLSGSVAGDTARGRAIVASRQVGLCLLCHTGPFPEEPFQGSLAPDLAGAGQRSTAAQLRLRIADASRFNPDTIMPSYFRTRGLDRVATAYRDKPILGAQQIEDVVAFLQTLKDPPAAERSR